MGTWTWSLVGASYAHCQGVINYVQVTYLDYSHSPVQYRLTQFNPLMLIDKIVVWISGTFDHNLEIKNNFTKYLKEICCLKSY